MQAPAGQICLLTGFFSVHFLRSLVENGAQRPLGAVFTYFSSWMCGLVGRALLARGRGQPPQSPRGGYGIRPYAVGVGVPDDPGWLPLPKVPAAGKARPYPFFPCNRFAIGFSTP